MEGTKMPMVWDLIDRFKCRCKMRGWWVSKYEDVIHANGEYHIFLWARKIYPKTFKNLALGHRYPIRENDLSYRMVDISYIAWLFPEKPPESIFMMVSEDKSLQRCIAIYDLSETYSGRPVCLKINETKSVVFREFEGFLESEYHINLASRLPPSPLRRASQYESIGLTV